jgi:hypothetical protein
VSITINRFVFGTIDPLAERLGHTEPAAAA